MAQDQKENLSTKEGDGELTLQQLDKVAGGGIRGAMAEHGPREHTEAVAQLIDRAK
jgi:hypothetical protein